MDIINYRTSRDKKANTIPLSGSSGEFSSSLGEAFVASSPPIFQKSALQYKATDYQLILADAGKTTVFDGVDLTCTAAVVDADSHESIFMVQNNNATDLTIVGVQELTSLKENEGVVLIADNVKSETRAMSTVSAAEASLLPFPPIAENFLQVNPEGTEWLNKTASEMIPALGVVGAIKKEFSKDTASGTVLATLPADTLIDIVQVRIGTMYDSVAPNMQIGTDANHTLLMDIPTSSMKEAQITKTISMVKLDVETEIKMFQDTDGATDGTGTILITYN